MLHATESIEILKPLPLVSGPGWLLKKRWISIRENSTFAAVPQSHQWFTLSRRDRCNPRERVYPHRPIRNPIRSYHRMSLPFTTLSSNVPFKSAMFNLRGKITGERYTRSVSTLPAAKPIPRDRAPDWLAEEHTSTSQGLIYRLSGDYNPLHVGTRLSPPLSTTSADGPKIRVQAAA